MMSFHSKHSSSLRFENDYLDHICELLGEAFLVDIVLIQPHP